MSNIWVFLFCVYIDNSPVKTAARNAIESRFSTVRTSWLAEYIPGWTWRPWGCSSIVCSVGSLKHDDSSRNNSLTKRYEIAKSLIQISWVITYKILQEACLFKYLLTKFATKVRRWHKPRICLPSRHSILTTRSLPTSSRSWSSSTFLYINETLFSYI